jgi:hypothetical protein
MTSDEFHELGEDMAPMDRKPQAHLPEPPLNRSALAPEVFGAEGLKIPGEGTEGRADPVTVLVQPALSARRTSA